MHRVPARASPRPSDTTGIPPAVRSTMELALGADFSDVRVHKNSPRPATFGADAYAQANHIHVAPGRWAPETPQGRRLLGHELAHVMQQRDGLVQATRQMKGTAVNDQPALEAQADSLGDRAARMDPQAAPVATFAEASPARHASSPRAPVAQMGNMFGRAAPVAKTVTRVARYKPGQVTNTKLAQMLKERNVVTHGANQQLDEIVPQTEPSLKTNPGTPGTQVYLWPGIQSSPYLVRPFVYLFYKTDIPGRAQNGGTDWVVDGSLSTDKAQGWTNQAQVKKVVGKILTGEELERE